jgi:hypothetical protein
MSSSRSVLNEELPEGYKFTPAENQLIDEAGTGNTDVGNQARMIRDLYATKITRILIDSNKDLAIANAKHAKAQNILTGVLAVATVVLAAATIFLVIATNNLAP